MYFGHLKRRFFLRLVVVACLALFFVACSEIYSDSAGSLLKADYSEVRIGKDSLANDLVRLYAKGAYTLLGTDDTLAKANERVKMKVVFDYDFSIGKSEVSCAEFNKFVKKKNSGLKKKQKCSSDDMPATNVTYFDAVLLANAKSVAKGLDTAYSYTHAIYSDDGNCENLEGLIYRIESNGYRLPNEAEWVLAASQGWNPENAWNASNSKYKAHKVCQKSENDLGLCDMPGNVMEWTNDWMGLFLDTTLHNFLGASEKKGVGERVIKGGSFRNAPSAINLYSRGDVYTVTSSTMADYVGVRLARGSIADPTWLNHQGKAENANIYVVASSSTLKKVTRVQKMKLAFRNDVSGNLSFVDYSQGVLKVVEINDTIDVYHPDISPDGRLVAFCTGIEGVKGPSKVFVRKLDEMGSDLVQLKVEKASIPRWRVNSDGDTVIVYVTDSGNNKDEAAWRSGSTWQVKFENGKFGEPEKLFDGSFHGGLSYDGKMALTGSQLLRSRKWSETGAEDSLWYNGEQACNASLSRRADKSSLFLDFASKTGSAFVGESYSPHERLFFADSNGNLVRAIAAPKGYTFDHTEWASNYARYYQNEVVVATLANANGLHSGIVMLNLADSSLIELVNGTELWHPSFWIGAYQPMGDTLSVDLDSIGIYLNSADDDNASIMMRYKMELLWKYKNVVKVAVIGSSRSMYSISPSYFVAEHSTVNFSHAPNSIYASRDFYLNYLDAHLINLNYLVVSLDIDFWNKIDGPKGDNFFAKKYKRYPGYVYDENHNYWKDALPQQIYRYTKNAVGIDSSVSRIYLEDRGRYIANGCNSWGGKTPGIEGDTTLFDNHSEYVENSLKALDTIIRVAANRDVTVIGVIFPQSPAYKKTGAFGRYGMRRSYAKKVIAQIDSLTLKYSNFVFWDKNKMGNHEFTDNFATDYDHLCFDGAILLSVQLDSLIKTLDKRRK